MASTVTSHDVVFEDEALASGFTQVWNYILLDPSLSVESRLLYIIFSYFGWKGDCFPGQERLGEIMDVTPRRVRDYTRELSEAGLLTVRQRGLGKTNVYVIHAPVTKSRPEENDRSGADENDRSGADADVPSDRTKMTGLTRAGEKGLKNTKYEEYDEKFDQNPETPNHEEQDHNLESDTEDSHISPASSMIAAGESKTSEQDLQTATDQPIDQDTNENLRNTEKPKDHRPARSDPKGGGHLSDQARRREERKAGKKPWEIHTPASTTAAVPLTKRQARKARTKGEAEKWLARHTSTSNS